jgi:hypothetical protein
MNKVTRHLGLSRKDKTDPSAARDAEIVAARERGETYQTIGERHNITGERVRRILYRRGRVDLTGRDVSRNIIPVPPCVICGEPTKSLGMKYCSWQCKAERTKTPERLHRLEAIKSGRLAGKTWNEVGQDTGFKVQPGEQASYYLRRYGHFINITARERRLIWPRAAS